ncbi:MAG: endolytic transglycosylase MltG [Candidatus Paceibacterota bacterium]
MSVCMEIEPEIIQPISNSKSKQLALSFGLVVLVCLLVFAYLQNPSRNFPIGEAVVIETGLSAAAIADELKDKEVVRSRWLLYAILVAFHDPASVKAGTYVFDAPLNTFAIASRITDIAPPADTVALTFPEGYTVHEYATIATAALPQFNAVAFKELASSSEGYLFPETYFVPYDYNEEELFLLLRATYDERTRHLQDVLSNNKLTENGIVILASIVEREANTPESMEMVAGILLSRIVLGMPLQVDAAMEYALATPLQELLPGELALQIRELDSPYNTYKYKGLPPTPIGNPGLTAIEAVLNPKNSDYLFYITGIDGEFYYAETLEEHNQNIARYLRE